MRVGHSNSSCVYGWRVILKLANQSQYASTLQTYLFQNASTVL